MNNNSRPLFVAACTGMLLFGVAMVSLGTVNSFLATILNLDQITLGSLAALLALGILAGSLVFGPVVDRSGYRLPFVGATVLLSAGFFSIAMIRTLPSLQVSFFVIGAGGGILNGATNALVADISEGAKGSRLSLLGVFFGIGALGMPALTGVLVDQVPLDMLILGIALVLLVPVAYFLFQRFPEPKQAQGLSLRKGFGLLREGTLLGFAFVLFFQSGLEGMVNNWTTGYLRQELRAEPAVALMALTLYGASLTAARLLAGIALRRMSGKRVVGACLAVSVAGGGLLLAATSIPAALGAVVLLGIGFAPVFPVVLGFVGDAYPKLTGTAFGIALVIALIGNTLLNYAVGHVTGAFGSGTYPVVVLACVAAAGVLFAVATRREHPDRT